MSTELKNTVADNASTSISDLLKNALRETGRDAQANLDEVRVYTAQRLIHLATCVGQPGYEEALVAEKDNVLLKAGIAAVNVADAADAKIIGIVVGAMSVGAHAIAGV